MCLEEEATQMFCIGEMWGHIDDILVQLWGNIYKLNAC